MAEQYSSSEFSDVVGDSGLRQVTDGFIDSNIIAESATSVVYSMRLAGRHVAVKRLRKEYNGDPTLLAAFSKEFSVGSRLKHAAFPTYIDYHSDISDETYIVMEYVGGSVLTSFLATDEGQRYFSSDRNVRRFFGGLIDAAAYLHRNHTVHCDIKADNIVLRDIDCGATLLDFDKCYTDAFDLTHGGTAGASTPAAVGEVPDAATDYRAIGRLLDSVSVSVAGFPIKKFRKFRKECDNPSLSYDSLRAALAESRKTVLPWVISGAVAMAATIVSGYAIVGDEKTPEQDAVPQVVAAVHEPVTDTTVSIDPAEPATQIQTDVYVGMLPEKENYEEIIKRELDKILIPLDEKLDTAFDVLRGGEAPDQEIHRLTFSLQECDSRLYQSALIEFKSKFNKVDPHEIEMTMGRVHNSSKIYYRLFEYVKEVADTMKRRHTSTYADEQ